MLSCVAAAEDEYIDDNSAKEVKDNVELWLSRLRSDAEFNVSAYVDCFLSENLVRSFISETGKGLTKPAETEAKKWVQIEKDRKNEASISFEIRKKSDELSYLGMDMLAICAEGGKAADGNPSLWKDAVSFRPVRNAVGHTGLLTQVAKNHLNVTFENIRARVKNLLANAK